MERRKGSNKPEKGNPLPSDYLKMVNDVLGNHFSKALVEISKLKKGARFVAGGWIYPNEVILGVSILFEKQIAATTFYASSDFDPKASAPKVEEVLAACLDGVGALIQKYVDLKGPKKKERFEALVSESFGALAEFEGTPVKWTEFEANRLKIHLRMDKWNPELESAADQWLEENDPEAAAEETANEDDDASDPH